MTHSHIQQDGQHYLAPDPVMEKPELPKYDERIHDGPDIILNHLSAEKRYAEWKSSWIECTGFEIGQEVPEGEWEMDYCGSAKGLLWVAIPKQHPEREEDEESYLFGICQWISKQPEYTNIPISTEKSIFYHVAPLSFAELIRRYFKEYAK